MTVKYKNLGKALSFYRREAMKKHFEKTGSNAPYRGEDLCKHFGKYETWYFNIESNQSPIDHSVLTQIVDYLKPQLPELTTQMILDKANS